MNELAVAADLRYRV